MDIVAVDPIESEWGSYFYSMSFSHQSLNFLSACKHKNILTFKSGHEMVLNPLWPILQSLFYSCHNQLALITQFLIIFSDFRLNFEDSV